MGLFGPSQDDIRAAVRVELEQRSADSPENPTVPVSAENFLSFFGIQSADRPHVTIDRALTVPAVWAAVAFLSRTLATLPLHAFVNGEKGPQRITDGVGSLLKTAWNDDTDEHEARRYFWQQVFTGGRGFAWVERNGREVVNLWPMVPNKVTVKRVGGRKIYRYEGKDYAPADVIDIPFMLKPDQLGHYGPIAMAAREIQLALAMTDYASGFFAGGGVPPLAVTGPTANGNEALKRSMDDIHRVIQVAKQSNKPLFPLPPGYEIKAIGFDPEKGQMTEARLHQIQEIARAYQLPPAFLQDLSRGTFANVEQQDLHLVKHLISQWAQALDRQLTLKLFGRDSGGRYVKHNLDGLLRGDFKTRAEGMARKIQTGQMTPNEARELDEMPRHDNLAADDLLIQGATVPLGTQPTLPVPVEQNNGDGDA